ncbi:ComEC/Rec2 family competence protein [Candidatus Gottesmanbacteria bacterium]|nr:ComEC/Rec2 family competence protein [Candidatus Gottesmanbacteria bacterium]
MTNPFVAPIQHLLSEPQASLLLGILFGIDGPMPRSFYQSLITTGTLHIIALSGINITILTTLTAKMLTFMGKKASSIITICLIVLFVLFVGASPSIVRASIMGSMNLVAIVFGRQNWGLLSLFLAAMVILLFDFSLVKDVSFQLSFLATLGILLANKPSKRQLQNRLRDQLFYFLKENLRLTLSAQLFTLPVIFLRFGRISLISPVANVLIEWAIQPIMILGFFTSLVSIIWLPLGIVPAWFTWVPLTYIITVIELLARIPFASIRF